MGNFPAAFWDERYAGEAYAYGEAPNAWLSECVGALPERADVLVPGDGEGRNGVFLAKRGHAVTTLDLSERGVGKARALAARNGVSVDARVQDLLTWDWPEGAFDAVVLIFVHLRPEGRQALHRRAAASLRPGGVLIIEGFTPEHLPLREANPKVGGPGRAGMLFTPAMLREDFGALDAITLEERRVRLSEGAKHDGEAAVVRGLFRAPA